MSERLKDQVAIVTGAASGIGYATAVRFAQEGAHVVAVDIDDVRLERLKQLPDISHEVDTRRVDIGDASQVKAAVAQIAGQFGCIHILVNSAAVFDMQPLNKATAQDIEASKRVNVHGTSCFVDEVSTVMITQAVPGSIVNVSSVSGMGAEAGKTVYSQTKAEILELTVSAALRLGRSGIRVNAVSPGPIFTEASYKHMKQIGVDEGTFTSGAKAGTLAGRMGRPEEVANAILFLASPEASYVTGANLVVDGGFNVIQNSSLAA